MDAFHERLARVAPARAAMYGFCLAGGYAVQAHGLLERPSEDIDLFTTMDAETQFPTAVAGVVQAYIADGLMVSMLVDTPGFARLSVPTNLNRRTAARRGDGTCDHRSRKDRLVLAGQHGICAVRSDCRAHAGHAQVVAQPPDQ